MLDAGAEWGDLCSVTHSPGYLPCCSLHWKHFGNNAATAGSKSINRHGNTSERSQPHLGSVYPVDQPTSTLLTRVPSQILPQLTASPIAWKPSCDGSSASNRGLDGLGSHPSGVAVPGPHGSSTSRRRRQSPLMTKVVPKQLSRPRQPRLRASRMPGGC